MTRKQAARRACYAIDNNKDWMFHKAGNGQWLWCSKKWANENPKHGPYYTPQQITLKDVH